MDDQITLTLPIKGVEFILQTLGQMPTISGAYPTFVAIDKQVKEWHHTRLAVEFNRMNVED